MDRTGAPQLWCILDEGVLHHAIGGSKVMRSQLCSSVIRLAGIARHSGRAADAVSELWPLITRLETRVAAGHAEAETMRLLARARVSFGVALGHLLPEARPVHRRPVDRPGPAYRVEPRRSGPAGVRAANARQRTA